jgi:hypothetical protein
MAHNHADLTLCFALVVSEDNHSFPPLELVNSMYCN